MNNLKTTLRKFQNKIDNKVLKTPHCLAKTADLMIMQVSQFLNSIIRDSQTSGLLVCHCRRLQNFDVRLTVQALNLQKKEPDNSCKSKKLVLAVVSCSRGQSSLFIKIFVIYFIFKNIIIFTYRSLVKCSTSYFVPLYCLFQVYHLRNKMESFIPLFDHYLVPEILHKLCNIN